ncbi:tetratricopeptide repeat protein [Teredinibacter purpureus]|uniref:tetratricopeptide repeat protein n=1 Tax=Teredinibacter purpureus TaxID=2731756 RepID=UPI0005F7B6CD|nr:tetratricopeptide repeat protein [Teredinibacter purpureus]
MTIFKQLATTLITTASVFLACTSHADQSNIDAIEHAFHTQDAAQLEQLANDISGYDQFVARYRLVLKYQFEKQPTLATSTLNGLIDDIASHCESHPEDAEAQALLGNLYGYSISLNPSKAMVYGPRAHDHITLAEMLDKENPRVQMFKGIMDFNKPAMFGGSKTAARDALIRAVAAFPSDRQSGNHWGYSDAHIWLGLCYLELGDTGSARKHWGKALDINPDGGWASMLLNSHPAP